jgi:hypothetical protein
LSAIQGNSNAQFNLGIYLLLTCGVEQGTSTPSYLLGLMYEIGNGQQKDLKEAERYCACKFIYLLHRYYKLSADQGHSDAQYCLGVIYESSDGMNKNNNISNDILEPDLNEAFKYIKLATDQGHTEAQYVLGLMYEIGNGVKQDLSYALKYLIMPYHVSTLMF